MALLSIEIICQDCGVRSGVLVERTQRNDPTECPECKGSNALRTMSTPNVSTAKTSAAIPDAVAQGRFDALREQQSIRKEVSKAKREYANNPTPAKAEEIKRARAEKKKVERR